jgi:DNA-binding response OmpR family regulator
MTSPKRILIVEDELEFAQLLKDRLEMGGYRVSIAQDAYAGTQAIIKEDFDLMVLDLTMPAGGGLAVLERMRQFPGKSNIPVVILTGKTIDEEVKAKAEKYHVNTILTKPVESHKFAGIIDKLLKVQEKAEQSTVISEQ